MNQEQKRKLCVGCGNDYYNHTEPQGCWMLKSALLVNRILVGVWQNPPYRKLPQKTLSCHDGGKGSTFISVDDVRVVEDSDEAVQKYNDRLARDVAAFRARQQGGDE